MIVWLVAAALGFQESPKDGPIALFNGKDLSGLTTWLKDAKREDPRKVFTVHDGMIHASGDGMGYLATGKEYKDYRLVVEYKWGRRRTAASTSGIRESSFTGPGRTAGRAGRGCRRSNASWPRVASAISS